MKFNPGDQIAYIPDHANGQIDHPDVEFGFIVKENPRMENVYVCRYFYYDHDKKQLGVLRTKANGENTNVRNLKIYKFTSYAHILSIWKRYVTTSTGDPIPIFLEDLYMDGLEARQDAYMDYDEPDLLESGDE